MNTYLQKNLNQIRAAFLTKSQFSVDEVTELLSSKRSTALWILSGLSRSGKIARVGRGIYTFDLKSLSYRSPRLGTEMEDVIDKLRNEGISFVVTGLDILLPFVQHQPSRILHLLYAAKGAGTWAQSLLKTTHFMPLLEPTRQEIEKMLDTIDGSTELIILREQSSKLGITNSLASLERAFVDLYYESSRELIPFSLLEVAHIFINIKASIFLNAAQMLRYAHERSIRDEIQNILNSIEEPRREETSERSREFLRLLRGIR